MLEIWKYNREAKLVNKDRNNPQAVTYDNDEIIEEALEAILEGGETKT